MRDLDLTIDGAALHRGAAFSILDEITAALAGLPSDRAGIRLAGRPALAALLERGPVAALVASRLPDAQPVRAVLFDKTARTNWGLGWHQDRTIAVRGRHDMPGFGPWTRKGGIQHVEPPFALIEQMLTLRIHLDDVPADNAPLLIAPGSHRLGRVAERDIAGIVATHGQETCLAARGDVWIYATPILHASQPASGQRRRVLQVDYAAQALPLPLVWHGI